MSILSYENALFGAGAFTGDLTNANGLGEMQLSDRAEGEGSKTFTFTPTANITVATLALIDHTLPVGSTVEWLEGTTQLAEITVVAGKKVVAYLDEPEEISELTCNITATGGYSIGAGWASQDFRTNVDAGWSRTHQDNSEVSFADTIFWPAKRGRTITQSISWGMLNEAKAMELDRILQRIGQHSPVLMALSTDTQARIQSTSIYGLISSPPSIQHREAGFFRARLDISG